MEIKELIDKISNELNVIKGESGAIVLSSVDTITKGNIYTLGLNPGGNIDVELTTIEERLMALPSKKDNDYTDPWLIDKSGNKMDSRYQTQYLKLMKQILLKVYKEGGDNFKKKFFGTNLIFSRSKDAKVINWMHYESCIKVHKLLLEYIDPPFILAIGISDNTSAYYWFKKEFSGSEIDRKKCENYKKLWCFASNIKINDKNKLLIGIPHLSRYSPEEIDINWIINQIKEYGSKKIFQLN